ncbi:MAG TPA: hypothetical protein VH593_21375 [Ktedonobacteraceae bacterium]|jgi:glyceraldehyde-3-phosphate dehydrogenase type II
MIQVGISGFGTLAAWLARGINAQPDMYIVDAGRESADVWVWCPSQFESDKASAQTLREEDTVVIVLSEAPSGPLFNAGQSSSEVQTARRLWVASPPLIGLLQLLSCIPDTRRVHLTVLAPAGVHSDATNGPIDALVPCHLSEMSHLRSDDKRRITWQAITVPHTRCWMVGCLLETTKEFMAAEVVSLLSAHSRIILTPPRVGLTDTAVLNDVFRDLGRPQGLFYETVVFTDYLVTTGREIALWFAVDVGACVAEAIDCIRVVVGRAGAQQSILETNQALGAFTDFPGVLDWDVR